jgi:hypothetical protein
MIARAIYFALASAIVYFVLPIAIESEVSIGQSAAIVLLTYLAAVIFAEVQGAQTVGGQDVRIHVVNMKEDDE